MTPLDYLHRLRVERAKQLLEVTLIDLTEVMEYCGYQDASRFDAFFAHYGLTPSEYQRRYTMRISSRRWRADEAGEDLIEGWGSTACNLRASTGPVGLPILARRHAGAALEGAVE
ncbi:helix-turn-helix domain-containing protein [Pseudomonas hygromyciniae]|uniref:helix-turn-helix domain-containing protein n=1 Tax=Pseudomonas hygromyciniae TaxID=2812000 RepID=UPI001F07F0DF|nr:helix-turn-helix domain-containing protein [Pseudomonas hygromyciniae]